MGIMMLMRELPDGHQLIQMSHISFSKDSHVF